jgi:hypothetical protein
MASAGVMLIASFLPLYSVGEDNVSLSWSSWSDAFSIFPLMPLTILLALALGGATAAVRFGNARLPDAFAGAPRIPIEMTLAKLIALTVLCYVVRPFDGIGKGVGGRVL